jgi:tRNA(fMet)-specific endonuclease VapC
MKYVLHINQRGLGPDGQRARGRRAVGGAAPERIAVPQPVFAEIAYGIERLPRSKRKDTLRARLELIRAELRSATWSDEVSDAFGTIKASLERDGNRIEDFDAAVAAHALAIGAVLVTRNTKHMVRVPNLQLANW